jgi:hypothetical protein
MARRQVDAVTSWLFTCLGDIAVQIVVGAFGGTPSDQFGHRPVGEPQG